MAESASTRMTTGRTVSVSNANRTRGYRPTRTTIRNRR
jgi:hypothetical protein